MLRSYVNLQKNNHKLCNNRIGKHRDKTLTAIWIFLATFIRALNKFLITILRFIGILVEEDTTFDDPALSGNLQFNYCLSKGLAGMWVTKICHPSLNGSLSKLWDQDRLLLISMLPDQNVPFRTRFCIYYLNQII